MQVDVKICGVNSLDALAAATGKAGSPAARWVGFVFYEPSPRALSFAEAQNLASQTPDAITRFGLVVDEGNDFLDSLLRTVTLDGIQLAGSESPERVATLRAHFGNDLLLAKALSVKSAESLPGLIAQAGAYAKAGADLLLLDSPPPKGGLPGGNALSFDWQILQGISLPLPWLLAGGLTPDNLSQAVATCGARAVDVSSGVEETRGVKSPAKIARFLNQAKNLPANPPSAQPLA